MNYFEEAIKEAIKAYKKGEIPVGAVIVKNDKVIAKAHNNRQFNHNVLGHAEINCILKAEKKIKDWRLNECDMYVTLEPCEMCNMFIKESRIKNVYYLMNKSNSAQTNVRSDLLAKYEDIVNNFFNNLRNN